MPDLRLVRTPLVAVLGVVLALAALVGCVDDGAGGTDPQTSTVETFCGALQDFDTEVDAADETDLAAYVATLKAAAEDLATVGVPDDMPEDARRGFDLTLARIAGLPDDATEDDVAQLGDVSDEQQRELDATNAYVEDACPGLSDDDASSSPSSSS